MPRLRLYVTDRVKRSAERAGLTVSRYLAEIATQHAEKSNWPEGYFDAVFGHEPELLVRPPQHEWRERQTLV